MINCIDYSLLARAQEFYASVGFKLIEVPWRVTEHVACLTKPITAISRGDYKLKLSDKCLIASGEQGFLYLANKGQLPPGRYQTITPCFRDEPYDFTYSKQFMKLELINLLPGKLSGVVEANHLVTEMARCSLNFFQLMVNERVVPEQRKETLLHTSSGSDDSPVIYKQGSQSSQQLDINLGSGWGDSVEIGSYGARECSVSSWIYGTGIAEPRFSKLLRQL